MTMPPGFFSFFFNNNFPKPLFIFLKFLYNNTQEALLISDRQRITTEDTVMEQLKISDKGLMAI